MKIPFNDLKAQWQDLIPQIKNDIINVIDNTNFISEKIDADFGTKLAKLHSVNNGIGCSDGTAALYLLLKSHEIGVGDEVIFPANTFIATAFAISMTGATPIPCDVEMNGLISSGKIKEKITDKTAAIVVVHLFGCAVNILPIIELAKDEGVLIFEDAAQVIANKEASMGKDTCGASISFYPGKNLGAFGQAGGILTNNDEMATKIKCLRNQGQVEKYIHKYKGGNFRLDTIQAIVLNYGLDKIEEWNNKRKAAGKLYRELIPAELLMSFDPNKTIEHIFPVVLPEHLNRDKVMEEMGKVGVSTAIHYPIPVHKTEAYKELNHIILPNCEYLCSRIVSLPMFVNITEEQIRYVSKILLEIIQG